MTQIIKAGFSTGVFTSGFADRFRSQWKITRKLEDRPKRSEHTIRSMTSGRSSVDEHTNVVSFSNKIFIELEMTQRPTSDPQISKGIFIRAIK